MSAAGDFIVVTGADGFVGAALGDQLRAARRHFRGLVRRITPATAGRVEYLAAGDLALVDDVTLDRAFAGARAVVHLAGRAHVMREHAPDPAAEYHAANVVASERVMRAAQRGGVERFVYVSTIKVQGESTEPGKPFRDEAVPLPPADLYAKSKWDAERSLAGIAEGGALALTILRPPLVYGPHVRGNFLELWRTVDRGVPLPIGLIDNRRQLLYVGNLAHAIVALVDVAPPAPGTFVIADLEALSTPDLARRMASAQGRRLLLLPVPAPLLSAAATLTGRAALATRVLGSLEIDASALAARIGPLPFSLDDGLAATADWWKAAKGRRY
ncbi:MAG: NAD-dependent epimerase/dehydratase family protein [Betaproteobacteria bacterium]